MFLWAAGTALRWGWDGDAVTYAKRASPLVRGLDQALPWMLLCGDVGFTALLAGDTATAHDAFCEELRLSHELAAPRTASQALTGLAAVAVVNNELERAARLAGAAAARRAGVTDDVVVPRLDATFLQPARTRFGADAWDAAARDGAVLDFNGAIAYALD